MQQLFEALADNDYVVLSAFACAVVILPILGCYAISWTRILMSAAH